MIFEMNGGRTEMEDILKKIRDMRPPLRVCSIQKTEDATCGFHLSRSQWDPYPWISNVDEGSPAATAGLKIGDFVIEVNDEDVLGLKIDEVAQKVRLKSDAVRLLVWKSNTTAEVGSSFCFLQYYSGQHDSNVVRRNLTALIESTENKLPTALNLQKFSCFLQSTLQLIECPVCLDFTSVPTFQCVNGHILCSGCRQKTNKCPMCRVQFSGKGRCLIAEKLHQLVFKTLSVKCAVKENSKFDETRRETACYFCPWNVPCNQILMGEKAVLDHLRVNHEGPYVQYEVHGDSVTVDVPKTQFALGISTRHRRLFLLRMDVFGTCWLSVLGSPKTAIEFSFTTNDCSEQYPVISLAEPQERNGYFQLPPNSNQLNLNIRYNGNKG